MHLGEARTAETVFFLGCTAAEVMAWLARLEAHRPCRQGPGWMGLRGRGHPEGDRVALACGLVRAAGALVAGLLSVVHKVARQEGRGSVLSGAPVSLCLCLVLGFQPLVVYDHVVRAAVAW